MKKNFRLVLLAIFLAVHIVMSLFYIQVGQNLRIYFTFIIAMTTAMLYEYPYVLAYAVFEDLLAFFLFPTGPFFPGYTLTTVVSLSIYHFFLYPHRHDLKLKHVILAKTFTNLIANIGLNSLWSSILYSKGFIYYLSKSVVKNLIMLPIEIFIFYSLYKLLKPLLIRYNLIKESKTSVDIE